MMFPNKHNQPNSDLILQIVDLGHKLKKDYKVNINMTHIKAHQDKHKSFEDLNHHEQINIIADNLAKNAKQFKSTPYIEVPLNQVSLIINDEHIIANIAQTWKKSVITA